jgi:chromosome segregation ATPase
LEAKLMDEQELPVVEWELHDGDPLQLAAELTMANKRIAELEAAVASIGGAVRNAVADIAQMEVDENRDECRMALNKARRVVEHERKLAATQDVWDRIGEIQTECARYGPALQEASECLRIQTERVAELEAENERLRAALMPLETSSLACAVQEAAAATMQRDQLQAALELERRAVESLAEHIETACDGFAHGSMSAMEVAPGGYTDAAEIAARARKQALEDAGDAR